MSRAVTLIVALLALHLMLGALSFVIGRGEHKSPALRWWGGGLLAYAAGLAWVVSGAFAWRGVAVTGGNALIAASAAMCVSGVLSHTRFRLDRRWVFAGLAVTVLILALNSVRPIPDRGVDFAVGTAMGVVVFVIGASFIARHGPRDSSTANRFLAAIMLFAALMWTARVVVFYLIRGRAGDVQALDEMSSVFAIAQMLIGVAATLALFWIDVRLMQAQLSRVADTDVLTGLPNRRWIMARFDEATARARRHDEPLGVAILDLDRFKDVNDAHGHTVGDAILKAAGSALAWAKRSDDVLARIGGEEFMVLLPACESADAAVRAIDRLREAIAGEGLAADGARLNVTASGGIAFYPDEGSDWNSLFAIADRRLYAAKAAGRNRVVATG